MAYAFDDSGSLQNTGSAMLLGSRVSPSRSLRRGRPTSSRFGTVNMFCTAPANDAAAAVRPRLDAFPTPGLGTLTPS